MDSNEFGRQLSDVSQLLTAVRIDVAEVRVKLEMLDRLEKRTYDLEKRTSHLENSRSRFLGAVAVLAAFGGGSAGFLATLFGS